MTRPANLPGEFELIARYFAPLAKGFPGAYGLLDDAAVIAPPPGHELVAKTDAIVGGVHFLPTDPPDLIARKALRVNLSDLAAKGAVPRAYMLDIMLPKTVTEEWIATFARGLAQDQDEYKRAFDRRRHGFDARPSDDCGHGVRRRTRPAGCSVAAVRGPEIRSS